MITPVKVPETPIIVTRPELEAEQQKGDEHHDHDVSPRCELLDTDSPPSLSPPLCDEEAPDDGDHGDQGGSEHSVHCQETQDVPVATLVTTAWDGEKRVRRQKPTFKQNFR